MLGVFLKLLIFRVMIACAIKHLLQALHVLVRKNLNYFVCVCVCLWVSENGLMCVFMSASTYSDVVMLHFWTVE